MTHPVPESPDPLVAAIGKAPRHKLAAVAAALAARLAEPEPPAPAPAPPPGTMPNGDRLLTAAEVALRLGLDPATVVRRRDFTFRRRIGRRTVRYSERGLNEWMRRQGGQA